MEEASKYYTPTIEEFHVGFEYEENYVETHNGVREFLWGKEVYDRDHFLNVGPDGEYEFDSIDKTIRVKYLDKVDIESVLKDIGCEIGDDNCTGGWSKSYLDELEWYVEGFHDKKGYDLFISKDKEKGLVSIENDETFIFIGVIKNKSELKVLLKQLGIE
jgi:hypothetical protein